MPVVKIISKSYECPMRFWKCISEENITNGITDYNSLDQTDQRRINMDIVSYGNGILINNNGVIYLVTCYHIVKNSYNTVFYIKDIKTPYKTTKVCDIFEMDMSILIPEKQTELEKYSIKSELLNTSLNMTGEFKLMTTNNNSGIELKENDFEISELKGSFDKLIFDKCTSLFFQNIPLISLNIDDIDDSYKYSGLSGSPITNKDNLFCGYISSFSNKLMQILIIPSQLIVYIFDMMANNTSFAGKLGTLHLETKTCEFSIESSRRTGHYITNNYNIKYKLTNKKPLFTFPNKSIIYKINDKYFDSNGYIKYNDASIPFDSYLLINNHMKYYNITYLDTVKKKINEIKIQPKDFTTNFIIYSNHKIVIHNGLVFTELSEELIKYMYNTGIHIDGETFNRYTKYLHYISTLSKTIVLVDVLYNLIDDRTAKIYKTLNFPLKNTGKGKYIIPILDSVNNKKITKLEDIVQSKTTLTLTFELEPKEYNVLKI